MKLEAIGVRENNKPFRVMYDKEFRANLDSLSPGKYRLTVESYKKNKSLPQLGYYFGCIIPLTHKLLLDAGWEFTTPEEVDAFWKDLYANKDIINKNTGEIMKVPALKRQMTTIDMMTFINAIRDHCAEYFQTYIPEPGEQLEFDETDQT